MSVPPSERYFEDYEVGVPEEFGAYEITEREIVEFATRYDPQPFHLDAAAARASIFGGLIASGWMTAGVMMRLLCDHYVSKASSMGSPGVDELRWVQPVRPGDVLRVRITPTEARRSTSKPDRGVVRSFTEVLNQRGEPVMTVRSMGMYRCRDAAERG